MAANAGNNESRDNANPIIQNGENIFYTQNAFPTGSMTILTVNYYDTYPALPSGVVIPTEIMGQKVLKQFGHSTSGKNTKDLPLASYVKNIEDDSWTKSFVYFDVKGRSIGGLTLNHLGGYTKTESELDFAGITRKSKTYHKRLAADTEKIITQTFEYDSQNRLMKHWHQVNGQPQELLTENRYNELSQLTNKKVGNNLQSIDYAYNIRGWMTKINDPAALNGKLFGYEMKYQNGAAGKYNGNISQVDWRTAQDEVLKRYSYQYDPLNRLKKATYSEPNSSIPGNDFFNESIDYDMNGNITSLQRNSKGVNGIKEQIDDLTYQYNGNRLNTVTDASTNYRGYPDVSGIPVVYDDNGNMKEHKDKGILEIRYNFLNLPTAMKFDQLYFTRGVWQNVNTAFTYRADGTKLKKVYKYSEDSVYKQKITEYLDGFQYEIVSTNADPLIKFVPTSEGYYNFENNKYIYSYVDHLGNVRVSYFNNGNGAEVLEENNYYPFGLKHEGYNTLAGNPAYKYQYNGKELQQETGWNDYGARMYMPELGRWGVMDPLSEKFFDFSNYNYVLNNPIKFIDKDGMDVYIMDENGKVILAKKENKDDIVFGYNSTTGNLNDNNGDNKIDDRDGQTVKTKGLIGQLQYYRDGNKEDIYPAYHQSIKEYSSQVEDDMFNLFQYSANNAKNVEFSLIDFSLGKKRYLSLQTYNESGFSPGSGQIGKDVSTNAEYHNHPFKTKYQEDYTEINSMGSRGNGIYYGAGGDYRNTVNYNVNYPNYVFFPKSTNLYNVTKTGIYLIKKINNKSENFKK